MGTVFSFNSSGNYSKALNEFDSFFEPFRDIDKKKKKMDINGISFQYRPRQDFLARGIMQAIREKKIYIVQAGVGIGKSMGYLIPIFITANNVTEFNKIIISTSNIGLQHQLQKEVENVSQMLNIPIKVAIAKGVNNYACLSIINELLQQGDVDSAIIQKIKNEIIENSIIDFDELQEISEKVRKKISLKSRSACNNCSLPCTYKQLHKNVSNANIVITNHNYFVQSTISGKDYIYDADMFVFDEAHKLEGAIRDIASFTYRYDEICKKINLYANNRNPLFPFRGQEYNNACNLIKDIGSFYSGVRKNCSNYFNKNCKDPSITITDCNYMPLQIEGLDTIISKIINELKTFLADMDNINNQIGIYNSQEIQYFRNLLSLFYDMLKTHNKEKICWVNYDEVNSITINYTCRDTSDISKSIFKRNIPIICTSGTLVDLNGRYEFFRNGLGLTDIIYGKDRIWEKTPPYYSPYDFKKNCLVYYDESMNNPKDNIDHYVEDLVHKLPLLMEMTHGRCLVLFTSKETMNKVYRRIDMSQFNFPVYIQGSESNNQLRQKFEKNVKSCLFATGAFWEGIDIRGSSLSHVIITRLPFANVDAIMEAKSNDIKGDIKNAVYLNDMLQKFAQGTGRLIRSKNDKGIISCLDPRITSYFEYIKRVTPFVNYTNDINEAIQFCNNNIISRDVSRPRKKALIPNNKKDNEV